MINITGMDKIDEHFVKMIEKFPYVFCTYCNRLLKVVNVSVTQERVSLYLYAGELAFPGRLSITVSVQNMDGSELEMPADFIIFPNVIRSLYDEIYYTNNK